MSDFVKRMFKAVFIVAILMSNQVNAQKVTKFFIAGEYEKAEKYCAKQKKEKRTNCYNELAGAYYDSAMYVQSAHAYANANNAEKVKQIVQNYNDSINYYNNKLVEANKNREKAAERHNKLAEQNKASYASLEAIVETCVANLRYSAKLTNAMNVYVNICELYDPKLKKEFENGFLIVNKEIADGVVVNEEGKILKMNLLILNSTVELINHFVSVAPILLEKEQKEKREMAKLRAAMGTLYGRNNINNSKDSNLTKTQENFIFIVDNCGYISKELTGLYESLDIVGIEQTVEALKQVTDFIDKNSESVQKLKDQR